jgi:hypothetical protein
MPTPKPPTASQEVPADAVDLLRPGDHPPTGPGATAPRCPISWIDVQDLIGEDPPWRCGRVHGHRGQHIAFSPGAQHIAAVLPPHP